MTNNNTMNGDVRACPCRDTFQSDIDTVVTLLDKASKKKGTANYKVRKNIVGNKVSMSLPILSYQIQPSLGNINVMEIN